MAEFPRVRLGEVLSLDVDQVSVDQAATYPMAGVYSFGRGLFVREPLEGSNTTYKVLNRLHQDDFVISQPKAWEGALARVPDTYAGRFLSPVFPTFRADKSKLDIKFFEWYCRQSVVWDELRRSARGIGARRESVLPSQFLALEIPLPPLDEQRRIVARIEALARRVEEARGLRREAVEAAEAMVLSELEQLLNTSNLNGYKIREVSDFTVFDRYGPRFYDETYVEDGTPIMRATDIDDHGRVNYATMPMLDVSLDEIKRLRFQVGDLAIVRSGSVGSSAVFDRSNFDCIPAAYLIQLRFDDSVDPYYVRYCLQTPTVKQSLAGRGTSLKNLNATKIKSTKIPTPPLPEQRRIVAYLDGLQAKVDALRRLQAETQRELDALMPSVLARAFAGEL